VLAEEYDDCVETEISENSPNGSRRNGFSDNILVSCSWLGLSRISCIAGTELALAEIKCVE